MARNETRICTTCPHISLYQYKYPIQHQISCNAASDSRRNVGLMLASSRPEKAVCIVELLSFASTSFVRPPLTPIPPAASHSLLSTHHECLSESPDAGPAANTLPNPRRHPPPQHTLYAVLVRLCDARSFSFLFFLFQVGTARTQSHNPARRRRSAKVCSIRQTTGAAQQASKAVFEAIFHHEQQQQGLGRDPHRPLLPAVDRCARGWCGWRGR